MTPDRLIKSQATQEAKRADYARQTLRIDGEWVIKRMDQYNWEIRHKGKFYGYYGSLLRAFEALDGKILDIEAVGTLAEIKQQHKDIVARVRDALREIEK